MESESEPEMLTCAKAQRHGRAWCVHGRGSDFGGLEFIEVP